MFKRSGNLIHLFWRFHYGTREWNRNRFDFPRCQEMVSNGWLYIGVTLFGHSLVYRSR